MDTKVPFTVTQDIIFLTASEWQDNPVSTMHIAAVLSRDHKVIFVETPGRRFPRLSELGRVWARLKRLFMGSSSQQTVRGLDPENVQIYSPIAIPIHNNRFFDGLNRRILTFQIKRLQKKHQIKNPLFWVFSPHWVNVVKNIQNQGVIFHCVDALSTYDSSQKFQRKFKKMAKMANVVFTPNKLLHEKLLQLNPKTFHIGHGCSELHLNFVLEGEPREFEKIPSPRIVYAGCLANWVDYGLLIDVATRLPECSFVLIGYIHALSPKEKIEKLLSLKNVFHVGYINFRRLPEFYHACDIGIIPYQSNNEHIKYCTPTKILDYFSAKLPCVSTRIPAVELLGNKITIADSSVEFAHAIRQIAQNKETVLLEARYQYARKYTWNNQVNKMLAAFHGAK